VLDHEDNKLNKDNKLDKDIKLHVTYLKKNNKWNCKTTGNTNSTLLFTI